MRISGTDDFRILHPGSDGLVISNPDDVSGALRDFVWESNRGEHVWFTADEVEPAAKLASRGL